MSQTRVLPTQQADTDTPWDNADYFGSIIGIVAYNCRARGIARVRPLFCTGKLARYRVNFYSANKISSSFWIIIRWDKSGKTWEPSLVEAREETQKQAAK